ncbi:MAG TPA: mycothiol system anti-sigma-R factor [Acidimicrobiales bacterium]|jgi:mycothiol system anti-sigma-R factor|nr:mycothiol system anti-sigma-R factor [Acidimicrobiales bacterium]
MGEDCDDAVHRLYDFLDGELDDKRRADIKRHLDECLPCLEAFDFEAELRMVIAQKCREQVPDGLRERISQALRHEPPLTPLPGPPPSGLGGGIPTL